MRLKFIFALAVVCGLSFSQLHAQQTAKITSSGIGYLEYLPQGYASNSNDYPIVIFLHGIGEKGTTSTDPTTLKNSVQKVANVGLPKYVKNGKQYPFILISPQLKGSYGTWPANYVMDVLNHVKKYLRVNEKRIYITGLSLGGFGTWTTLGAYPKTFASAVAICSGGNALSKACAIAAENVPLWGFHGTADNIVHYTKTTSMIDAINACTPKPSPLAKVTLFSGANHIIWDRVYNETDAINWMLGYTKSTPVSTTTTNNPPVVSAGADKSITLPANEVYIQGTASDNDGSIASYKWTKVSGGSASLEAATTSKLRAYNLVQGTYVFRLTVADNKGATKYDDVQVTVNPTSTTNIPPVANAGPDKSTSSSTYTVVGSGTDEDGTIVSYRWVQTYGPSVTMTNANTSRLTLSGMKNAKYFFKLVVTDDKGASDEDHMHVVVSGVTSTASLSSPTNIAPLVSAGIDRTTTATSIMIYGSASDKDGRIVSYNWTQYGGAATTLRNTTTPTLTVIGLRDGKYYFRLAATDDGGATGFDDMLLTVNRSTSTSSIRRVTSDAILQNDVSAIMVTDLEIGRYSMKLRGIEDEITTDPDDAIGDVNES